MLKTQEEHRYKFHCPIRHPSRDIIKIRFHISIYKAVYARFSEVQNEPFSTKAKNRTLCDSKRSSFITDFLELQLDTATFILPSFRMILVQARGCKQRFESDLLSNYQVPTWYLVGFICNTIIPGTAVVQYHTSHSSSTNTEDQRPNGQGGP